MLNQLFINSAVAQEIANPAQSEFSLSSFVPITLIFLIFYFLIIRPQSKKIKQHQELVNNLKTNTKVMTSSGIFGVIKEIDKDGKVDVEIADQVVIKVLKTHISEVVEDKKTEEKKSKKSLKNQKK